MHLKKEVAIPVALVAVLILGTVYYIARNNSFIKSGIFSNTQEILLRTAKENDAIVKENDSIQKLMKLTQMNIEQTSMIKSQLDKLSEKMKRESEKADAMRAETEKADALRAAAVKAEALKADVAKNSKESKEKEILDLKLDLETVQKMEDSLGVMNDKWIVVTTIFSPTEDMRKLAKIAGWKMVVVGDKKTPSDWKIDGVVFLSIDDQESSGMETVKHLKYGVYQRKNMGYLYAIRHGAKYIYDTDDDNHPYGGVVHFDDLETNKEYLVYADDRPYYNPFAHFGQSTIWPRGLPLNRIATGVSRTYRKCTGVRPLVQQGVVDGDPDLDAIQRLTRKDLDTKFNVTFDKDAPPVIIPSNAFTPYNTQNTIHHYDAFFALVLPQTVTFRVNDIWRGYIAQRMMWDIGGHLAYYTATAFQDRTPHDFLQDFIEEDDLYKKALPLTKILLNWKSTEPHMYTRYFELMKVLYKEGIFGELDVKLVRSWFRDLYRIGYKFPAPLGSTMKCSKTTTTFHPVEQPSMYLRMGKKTVNVFTKDKVKLKAMI